MLVRTHLVVVVAEAVMHGLCRGRIFVERRVWRGGRDGVFWVGGILRTGRHGSFRRFGREDVDGMFVVGCGCFDDGDVGIRSGQRRRRLRRLREGQKLILRLSWFFYLMLPRIRWRQVNLSPLHWIE